MISVAILTGGPAAERGISMKSAKLVETYLNPSRYTSRMIVLEEDGWIDRDSGEKVNLNDFSLTTSSGRISFDFVFLMIHGTPAEDGKIQGFFEYRGIPHSTCNTLSASLTFNKQKCKDFLKAFDIPMAPSHIITRDGHSESDLVLDLGLPLFVKPNNNGSSYGISKVKSAAELPVAIEKAFQFDHEVIVESFLDGVEYSAGVVREGKKLHAFPVTEIRPHGEFFDYDAKYEGASEEITPARLTADLMEKCQSRSKKLFGLLDCRGMVRFDYILVDGEFYLLEVNTIPGLSEASIVPQQAKAYGWSIGKLLDVVIDDCMDNK